MSRVPPRHGVVPFSSVWNRLRRLYRHYSPSSRVKSVSILTAGVQSFHTPPSKKRHRFTPKRVLLFLLFSALVLVLVLFFLSSRSPFPSQLSSGTCFCPPPASIQRCQSRLLHRVPFIAIAEDLQISPSTEDGISVKLKRIYRGTPQALIPPRVYLPSSSLSLCFPRSSSPVHSRWLVLAGGLAPINKTSERLQLLPATFSGHGCHASRKHARVLYEQRMVYLTPISDTPTTKVYLPLTLATTLSAVGDPHDWRFLGGYIHVPFVRAYRDAQEVLKSPTAARQFYSTSPMHAGKTGVSLIAACKNRHKTLQRAIPSWIASGVQEVVLVDWASTPPIVAPKSDSRIKIVIVRVEQQQNWVLSRAYNLAASFASFRNLLKVDCDTLLHPSFLKSHSLQPSGGNGNSSEFKLFYAGDWRVLHSSSEALHSNGLLYLPTLFFRAVGGYDERIVTYGWDDSDIVQRLEKLGAKSKPIRYDSIEHLKHAYSLRVSNQTTLIPEGNPLAPSVEIQRNRLLLTKFGLSVWNLAEDDGILPTQWMHDVKSRSGSGAGLQIVAKALSNVPAVSDLIADSDLNDANKRAIRLILQRYNVQFLPRSLSLPFYRGLVRKLAFPTKFAEVVLVLRGSEMARLLAHVSAKIATQSETSKLLIKPPVEFESWRVRVLWEASERCTCKFTDLFEAVDEEITPLWTDEVNTLPTLKGSVEDVEKNVVSVLNQFNTNAVVKNASESVLKWNNDANVTVNSRMLISELTCMPPLSSLSSDLKAEIRQYLQDLMPSSKLQISLEASLSLSNPSLLDSPYLRPKSWSSLIGVEDSQDILSVFDEYVHSMAMRWSSTQLGDARYVDRLIHRASVLAVLLRFEHKRELGSHPTDKTSHRVLELATRYSRRVDELFRGCRAQRKELLDAFPELYIILAGLFSVPPCSF